MACMRWMGGPNWVFACRGERRRRASYEHRVAPIGVVQTPIRGHTCGSSVDENFGPLNVGLDLGRWLDAR